MNEHDPESGYVEVNEHSEERLRMVNEMMDKLKTNSAKLKELGILRLYLFGSTLKGNAKVDSDIDIFMIIKSYSGDEWERQVAGDELIRNLLSTPEFPAITLHRGLDRKRAINIDWDDQNENNIELPDYAQDSFLIWSADE